MDISCEAVVDLVVERPPKEGSKEAVVEEEAARKIAEEEAARKAVEEDAARKAAEEEAKASVTLPVAAPARPCLGRSDLTEEDELWLKQVFEGFDSDVSGDLEVPELRKVLNKLGKR